MGECQHFVGDGWQLSMTIVDGQKLHDQKRYLKVHLSASKSTFICLAAVLLALMITTTSHHPQRSATFL